ncbi:MAG: winged helix-turn-helix domain-containing protein [Candidatus Nanopelagicales bacterium]
MESQATPEPRGSVDRSWTLLTSHGRVLLLIAADPDARIRDLAADAGITERSTHLIIADLEEAGYLRRHRQGRRNRYEVLPEQPFRHRAEAGHTVGELMRVFE